MGRTQVFRRHLLPRRSSGFVALKRFVSYLGDSEFPVSSKPNQKNLEHRLSSAVDAVNDRKLPAELRGRANAVRSETDIANVVEQRIWRSMEEGQFENLPGKGKPLDLSGNPHADPADDTLYRILAKNGCAPEWIELNKEIRSSIREWRLTLKKYLSNDPADDDSVRIDRSRSLKSLMADINSKVLRYNLMVPFGRQMFGLKWEKEVERAKEELHDGEACKH